MSENRSDLREYVVDLEARVAELQKLLLESERRDVAGDAKVKRLEAEVEKLREEIADVEEGWVSCLAKAEAERDRLQGEVNAFEASEWSKLHRAVVAERDRLAGLLYETKGKLPSSHGILHHRISLALEGKAE